MEFFEVVHTQRAIRRLKRDPVPATLIRQLLETAVCAPSGGNRQGWRFIVVREAGTKARMAELYREGFEELLKTAPDYRTAAAAPADSPDGKLMGSARHLAEHLAEAPILILTCLDTGGRPPNFTMGASIHPAVQNLKLAARSGSAARSRRSTASATGRCGSCWASRRRGNGGTHPARLSAREVRAAPAQARRRGHVRRPLGRAAILVSRVRRVEPSPRF